MRLISIACGKGNRTGRISILQQHSSLTGASNLTIGVVGHAGSPQETALERAERIVRRLIGEQGLDHFILAEVILLHQALDKIFGVIKRGKLKEICSQLKAATCFGQKYAAIEQLACRNEREEGTRLERNGHD